jgi:hypothetical protein
MSMNNQKRKGRRKIAAVSCGLLIVISLMTFLGQISISDVIGYPGNEDNKIYDKEWISTLKRVVDIIPENETLASIGSMPQVVYFSDRKVISPWVESERSLVEVMWKNNCSYLLISEVIWRKPNNTPLIIEMAEKPFEIITDYYDEYISKLKPNNTPLLNTSEPKPDNTRLSLKSIKEEKAFEKILGYNSTSSTFDLYHIRSNITRDNLDIVTDRTRPMLFVSLPTNGTIIESEFGVLRVNVTGTAIDPDSNIKKVEVSIGGLPFKLANPRAPDDWSTWSFSDIVTSEGNTKRIVAKATNNADKTISFPLYITVK